jgi:hypothetical protein
MGQLASVRGLMENLDAAALANPDGGNDADDEPVRPVHTAKSARIMAGIGWSIVVVCLGTLGLAIRLVGAPPWWNASQPIIWIPILLTIYAAIRDSRWLTLGSALSVLVLVAVGLADRSDGRNALGFYEILLGLSGVALTVTAFAGHVRKPTAPTVSTDALVH